MGSAYELCRSDPRSREETLWHHSGMAVSREDLPSCSELMYPALMAVHALGDVSERHQISTFR